ncbi:helix-turn-helix domain-containing protein [Comamonas sp. Z1]|uniref:helix-turn-helix domain-containing protein n=1 Tax=Comamonas sp. Z1 TaxID=2601246 RepID=UPI0011E6240B|nr:helix-turn-helix domain-containing protein [Comamonas sp. Z1]TYK70309.1 helix-turn-helix domain-containing protein [Comamonas sp. Z1]
MKKQNLFHTYQQRADAKPMWQIAYEAGAGSVEFLRQVALGRRKASEPLARGIEISTDGHVTRKMLRPDVYEDVWGDARGVFARMQEVAACPETVRRRYMGFDDGQASEAGPV